MNDKTLIIITVCLFVFAGIHGASINGNDAISSVANSSDTIEIDPKPYIKLNASHNETEFYRPIYVRTLARQKSGEKSLTIR